MKNDTSVYNEKQPIYEKLLVSIKIVNSALSFVTALNIIKSIRQTPEGMSTYIDVVDPLILPSFIYLNMIHDDSKKKKDVVGEGLVSGPVSDDDDDETAVPVPTPVSTPIFTPGAAITATDTPITKNDGLSEDVCKNLTENFEPGKLQVNGARDILNKYQENMNM